MIIKGIPFRVWKRVISILNGFFFAVTLITPLIALIFYIFEADFDLFFTKSELTASKSKKPAEKIIPQQELSILDETEVPFIPIPEINEHIKFTHYNARPDVDPKSEKTISLATNKETITAIPHASIFLNCNEQSNISFSEEKTPYKLTPVKVSEKGLLLTLDTVYTNKKGEVIYKASKDVYLEKAFNSDAKISTQSNNAFKSLNKAKFFAPDTLMNLDTSKESKDKKGLFRLCLGTSKNAKPLYIKAGDSLSYQNSHWVKGSKTTHKKPLLTIDSVSGDHLKATFYASSGFFHKNIELKTQRDSQKTLQSFVFEKITKRNKNSIIAKIESKTLIIKENDWFVKEDSNWKMISSANQLDNLINLQDQKEILICESIAPKNNQDYFIAYLFDKTRSNYKKIEIPLNKNPGKEYSR